MHASSPDYLGALVQIEADLRLVVSSRGASYDVQRLETGNQWRTLRALPELRFLWNWCFVNEVDLSSAAEAALDALPNDPHECLSIPYAGGRRPRL